ncbi:MAG: serine hydrolase, partial [Planctomycetota bacterium]
MSKLLKFFAFVGVLLVIGLAYRQYNAKDMPTKIKEIDTLLAAFEDLDKFNGAALVAQNGEVLLQKGYGIKNAEEGTAHDESSLFRIYSVTKPFTSTVVFKLIEDGKLSLNDKLSKFYPDIPHADEITIEHLLTHTSGLYEFTREAGFENSEANLVKLLQDKSLDFPVGASWSYCNSGYCMLGHIIAKVSGASYEEVVTKTIFEPLQMNESGFQFDELDHVNKSVGYLVLSDDTDQPVDAGSDSGPFAAGAIYSTVGDLWKFHLGLRSGQIIRADSLAKAQSACERNPGYGCGWQLDQRWFMKTMVSHSGGAAGFRSQFAFVPESDACVILLNNHEHADLPYLSNQLFDILDGGQVDVPTEVKLAADDLEPFTGTFEVTGPRRSYIRTYLLGGRLAADLDGEPQGTLLAQGDGEFEQLEGNAYLKFLANEKGEYTVISVKQGGFKLLGTRVSGELEIPAWAADRLRRSLRRSDEGSDQWHENAYRMAHALAHNKQDKQFHRLCEQTMQAYGDTESPQIAERTVKMCLFSDRFDENLLDSVGELADRAFAGTDEAGTFQWGGTVSWAPYLAVAKGMADYRRGDFESSINVLKSAAPFGPLDNHS